MNSTSCASIAVSYDTGSIHYIAWRYNGSIIDVTGNSRFSIPDHGGLIIDRVQPTDAGCYELTVSNHLGCETANFSVFVNCEQFCMHDTSPIALLHGGKWLVANWINNRGRSRNFQGGVQQ